MAYGVEGPFGIAWGVLGLLLVPLLILLTIGLVVAYRGRVFTVRRGLLVGLASGAAAWTFFTVGAPVVVPDAEDPQGIECVVVASYDPTPVTLGDDDCSRALKGHLVVSVGPSVVMVGGTLAAIAIALTRRRRVLADPGSAGIALTSP